MERKLSITVITLMVVIVVGAFIKKHNDNKQIEKNLGVTICKYTFCKNYPKSKIAFVKYCIDNKIFRNEAGSCPDNYNKKLNKYFVLKYSTIDPNKIDVDFSKEVTDKSQIGELELNLKDWFNK